MSTGKTIEIEFRALLTKDTYQHLQQTLSAKAKDLGADDKRVWFFIMPDKLLKVTHNVTRKNGKITLKLAKIGEGSAFEEIEYPIAEQDVVKAVELFQKLGHNYLLEPTILRHNYSYKGVELALKYSKSWGYHLELEVVVEDVGQQAETEQQIRTIAHELKVSIMTDQELKTLTDQIETNYAAPVGADAAFEKIFSKGAETAKKLGITSEEDVDRILDTK